MTIPLNSGNCRSIDAIGLSARQRRLDKDADGYQSEARELLIELEKIDLLPCRATDVTILAGGRVNFCIGHFEGGNGSSFLKVSPGSLERSYYQHVLGRRLVSRGESFEVPKCKDLRSFESINVFVFQWMDDLVTLRDNAFDEIRVRGLGEYSAANVVNSKESKLSGIPTHRQHIRDSSLKILADAGLDPELLEAQGQIIRAWRSVTTALGKGPSALCVRDSGRANVVVQGNKAILIDNGATHYAPVGFDLWSYLDGPDDMIVAAERLSRIYAESAQTIGVEISREFILLSGLAAACIMGLDTFITNAGYRKEKRIAQLQSVAFELIKTCG